MGGYPDMMWEFRSRATKVGPRQKISGTAPGQKCYRTTNPDISGSWGKFQSKPIQTLGHEFSLYRLNLQIEKTLRAQDNHGWKIRLFSFFCERLCCDAYDLKKLALLNLKNKNNIISHLTFKISNSIIVKRKNWKCLVV